MTSNDTMSIYGLWVFNPNLFSEMRIPTGLDADTLIDSIVMECAELELLYPDGGFMQSMIGLWSRKEIGVWQKLVDTLALEYNPIWNKDGLIQETRETESSGEIGSSGTTTNKVSAYNEEGFHNRNEDTSTGKSESSGKAKETYERRETGNIGVTTSQQMVKEELEIRKKNVYDYIVKSFKSRFCLLIY